MPSKHYKVTRPRGDYGPGTTHTHVSGRVLILERGQSEVVDLDPETEDTYLRSLSDRFKVEEVVEEPEGVKDPGLNAFLAGKKKGSKAVPVPEPAASDGLGPEHPEPPVVIDSGEPVPGDSVLLRDLKPGEMLTEAPLPAGSPIKEVV